MHTHTNTHTVPVSPWRPFQIPADRWDLSPESASAAAAQSDGKHTNSQIKSVSLMKWILGSLFQVQCCGEKINHIFKSHFLSPVCLPVRWLSCVWWPISARCHAAPPDRSPGRSSSPEWGKGVQKELVIKKNPKKTKPNFFLRQFLIWGHSSWWRCLLSFRLFRNGTD